MNTREDIEAVLVEYLYFDKTAPKYPKLYDDMVDALLAILASSRKDSGSYDKPVASGDTSDGYHTFDELYAHRIALFVALMAAYPELSWWSFQHEDGSVMKGWLIAGMDLPTGPITYHLPVGSQQYLNHDNYRDKAPKWDGHTAADVVSRLEDWSANTELNSELAQATLNKKGKE